MIILLNLQLPHSDIMIVIKLNFSYDITFRMSLKKISHVLAAKQFSMPFALPGSF